MPFTVFTIFKPYSSLDNSILIELFYGQYISETTCPECHHKTHNYEPFSTINLPISSNDSVHNIYDCFDLLTKVEELDEDNKLKCDKCDKYQQSKKKLYFWKVPNILIIFFNRFRDPANCSKEIDFPINKLNIEKYCYNYHDNENIYNLFGIGNYIGNGNCGHYSATIKNKNGKWYHLDDENIQEIDENDIINNRRYAYCLMYQKVKN